jgi:spore germination protein YaaH
MRYKAPNRVKTLNYIQKIKLAVAGFALVFMVIAFLPLFRANSQSKTVVNVPAVTKEETFSIKGSVFLTVAEKGQQLMVNLPDIEVFLRNEASGAEIGRTITDSDGMFHILNQLEDGEFKVCWRGKGWQDGCDAEIISKNSPVQFISPLEVKPAVKKNLSSEVESGAIAGQVTMLDGTPCTHQNESLGILQESFVQVIDKSGKAITQPIKTNNEGFFAITEVADRNVTLKAVCGNSTAVKSLQTNKSGEAILSNQLKFNNSNPNILNVVAFSGNEGIRAAKPGQKIRIKATVADAQGDKLKYDFIIPKNSGSLGKVINNSAEWQLPDRPGNFTAYVVVSDNKGGVAFKAFSIIVNSNSAVMCSGIVVDENNRPISDATVAVKGKSVQTGANGGFIMPDVTSDKYYVMNITKPGYIPVSRVYDSGKNSLTWKMAKAFSITVDPTKEITVVEPKRETRNGTRAGSTLKIPANALINTRTKQIAQSPLQLNIATLDVGAGELPGNNGALKRNKINTGLISYGAVFIEIRDEKGDIYNLASGTKSRASLTLPVEPQMLRNARAGIPTSAFNPTTGTWEAMGTARLESNVWRMSLSAISTINADLEFINPACVQVNIEDNSILLGKKARFTSPNFAQPFDLPLDDSITMIHHLPPHIPLNVAVIDSANNVISNIKISQNIVNGAVITNPFDSGAATSPPEPPYPYSSCDQKIKLEIAPPGRQFLTKKGIGSDTTALAYINVIDPLPGNRRTLGDWWQQNGFDQNGAATGEVSSAYFNDNDLHFGREMHCLQRGEDIACYVTNYKDANAAQAALKDPTKKVSKATVTMEYRAIDGQPADQRIVKFFAYEGGLADAPLLLSPDLDKNGPKGMPQLCIQCHGGNYTPANRNEPTLKEVNLRASFREFDLDTFLYPATNPRDAQEANFKSLNDMVAASAPSPAIQELIAGWYQGGAPRQDNSFVPPDWSSNPDLYLKVVATSCRTCHIAQPDNSNRGGDSGIDFTKFDIPSSNSDFKGRVFQSAFCGSGKYMPHAKVTYENFWVSANPARPQLLAQTLFNTPCIP